MSNVYLNEKDVDFLFLFLNIFIFVNSALKQSR